MARPQAPDFDQRRSHIVERAVHLPDDDPLPEPDGHASLPGAAAVDLSVPFKIAKQQLIDAFERDYIKALLRAARYNVSEAARRAKIDRMYLHKLITQHRLNETE